MRLGFIRGNWKIAPACAVLLACGLFGPPRAAAQNPDTVPAGQSAAQAKGIVRQMVDAMGGSAYLNLKDSDCTGRLAQFSPITGERGAYSEFQEYRIVPDKLRREYTKKSKIIDVYNGNDGWSLDRGGVEAGDAIAIANFQAAVKMGLDFLLRYRLNDAALYYHWGGEDAVDLKVVDWVVIEDTDEKTYKIAVDRATHLPVHYVVSTRDPKTEDLTLDTTIYANWHVQDGLPTAMTISHERDGRPLAQSFYYGCKFNTNLSPDFFTRQALVQKWHQEGHKGS